MGLFSKKKPVQTEQPKVKTLYERFGGKENKLIFALKTAITALQKDIISYSWSQHDSCNCGIVVQAILGMDRQNTGRLFLHARNESAAFDEKQRATWRDVLQKSCSITGRPLTEVFKILEDKGLKPEDIVHLEYLNNKGILEISNIDTDEKEYYTKKENLIIYLKSWLKILDGRYEEEKLSQRAVLEAKLLIAKNGEQFEECSRLKDELILLN